MIDVEIERQELEDGISMMADSFLDKNVQSEWNAYLTDAVNCANLRDYESLDRHLVWIIGLLSTYMAGAAEYIGRVRRITGQWG